jgi:hypothetical protein
MTDSSKDALGTSSDVIYVPDTYKHLDIRRIMCSDDVAALDTLANETSKTGALITAVSYLAAFRIHQLYRKVDTVSDEVLRRHLRMLGHDAPKTGATGLRRFYCETVFGWETLSSWRNDWASGAPVSSSSIWSKMADIQGWRNWGVGWDTILLLLTNTPMAGRDAINKPIQQEALPPGGKAQYLEELAELSPGQARKKVSEDSGEIQTWLADAQWHQDGLLLKVILEMSDGMETYDLIIRQVSSHESWYSVGHWLAQKLGIRMKIGGQ